MTKLILIITIESGGLAIRRVLPSGLRCRNPKFESRNGKRLGLNPTPPTSTLVGLE